MRSAEATGTKAGLWRAELGQVSAPTRARRSSRTRRGPAHADSAGVAITSSLFLVLLAAALLIGGHATIDPLLKSAIAARAAHRTGDIVFTMPDGVFCRHMTFDNTTAEITEGTIDQCPNDAAGRSGTTRKFEWSAH